ncbi:hypothetical protein GYW21_09880 [Lactobacillus mellis]|nr:hypothetical protein [Bombilactobacillus mellis]
MDTSQVTDMSNMFAYCGILPSLDVSHFDTSHSPLCPRCLQTVRIN